MDNNSSAIEKTILNRDFVYEPPYFYNNALALRCELGIGDTDEIYLANAKSRAKAIFDILFEKGVDMFFFDSYIYDWDFDAGEIYINNVVAMERNKLKFCLGYQKKFEHKVVRDIPFDKEETWAIRRNRICCYPDKKFNATEALNAQIDSDKNPTIHLVSFTNDCIFTVYDDRGCDIVFYDKSKFIKFYPLLKEFFLDYDRELMAQRFKDNT